VFRIGGQPHYSDKFLSTKDKNNNSLCVLFLILPLDNRKVNNPTKGDHWTMGITQQSNNDKKNNKTKRNDKTMMLFLWLPTNSEHNKKVRLPGLVILEL
jgi:hypothetical protein